MSRVYNFSAGPAALPESVLQQAQAEMVDWQGKGLSVMEMSHRSKEFISIAETAEQDLRELLNIPSNYKVLFLQGGASTQFAMVALNLLQGNNEVEYVNSGLWSEKAIAEAKKYCTVHVKIDGKPSKYTTIAPPATWDRNPRVAYLHYTPNETINGLEIQDVPDWGDTPLVVDMSSTLLSRPIDVSKFGVIYAGAQKNIGPAGLTVVIIREDLVGKTIPGIPTMLDYKIHVENASMYNTLQLMRGTSPGLVFKWLKELGGLEKMAEINKRKADKLYAAIDGSNGFYRNPVDVNFRSWMNVPFVTTKTELEKVFLSEASKVGLSTLAGHRSVGGMRASIYNAMPEAGVDALVSFMAEFAKQHAE
ncbi:MAG: 3-phosphoserine/phosphohydroxythreonine transaminase [Thiotrichaceae bacterium]